MTNSQLDQSVEQLRDRLIFVLQDVSPHRGRYSYLEEQTGVSANRWQNLFLKRLAPTADMVYATIFLKPQYASWLIFGFPGVGDCQASPEMDRWLKFNELREYKASNLEKTFACESAREA